MDEQPSFTQLQSLQADDMTLTTRKLDTRALSSSFTLSSEQSEFFKAQIGIDDDEVLKQHMLEVQERAYKVFPYHCIRSFSFIHLEITTLSVYERICALSRERPNAIFLDVGACFGVDGRKVAADGFSVKNIVNFDLQREFSDLGHKLFKTTPALYPVNFIAGDALDKNMLDVVPPFDEAPLTETPMLSALTSLNPLAGHCSVVHASRFFHLFPEEKQWHLARALAGLLSPQPGSIICGQHLGGHEKGMAQIEYGGKMFETFCHSPQSWADLWDGGVFSKGKIKVEATLMPVETSEGFKYLLIRWSVVRI